MLNALFSTVGKTRFGHSINIPMNDEEIILILQSTQEKQYSLEDYFDIYCAFEYLTQRSIKHQTKDYFNDTTFSKFKKVIIDECLTDVIIRDFRSKYGLTTSIDVCKFGSKFVNIEFNGF